MFANGRIKNVKNPQTMANNIVNDKQEFKNQIKPTIKIATPNDVKNNRFALDVNFNFTFDFRFNKPIAKTINKIADKINNQSIENNAPIDANKIEPISA